MVAALGLVVLLVGACESGPADSSQKQPGGADADSTLVVSAPSSDALPSDAEAVPAGDVALVNTPVGSFSGSLPTTGISCDENGFMKIDTSDGTYFVGVVKAGQWDCSKALDQWKSVSKSGDSIGMRYTVTNDSETLMLVSDDGGSMTMRIKGLWHTS